MGVEEALTETKICKLREWYQERKQVLAMSHPKGFPWPSTCIMKIYWPSRQETRPPRKWTRGYHEYWSENLGYMAARRTSRQNI